MIKCSLKDVAFWPTRACFTLPQLSRHATLKLSTGTWPSRFQSSGRTRATILGSLQWWVRNWWRVSPTRCDSYANFFQLKMIKQCQSPTSQKSCTSGDLFDWLRVTHDSFSTFSLRRSWFQFNACRETQRFSKCLVNVQGATTTTCLKVRFWNQ